jgi:hypothetical protein
VEARKPSRAPPTPPKLVKLKKPNLQSYGKKPNIQSFSYGEKTPPPPMMISKKSPRAAIPPPSYDDEEEEEEPSRSHRRKEITVLEIRKGQLFAFDLFVFCSDFIFSSQGMTKRGK